MGHAALLAAHAQGIASLTLSPKPHLSHSLNSLKGDYIGDYIGDYYRAY